MIPEGYMTYIGIVIKILGALLTALEMFQSGSVNAAAQGLGLVGTTMAIAGRGIQDVGQRRAIGRAGADKGA